MDSSAEEGFAGVAGQGSEVVTFGDVAADGAKLGGLLPDF